MLYRKIGRTDIECSCIALGTWELAGNVWGNVSNGNAIRTVQTAVDSGITLIDTAASYGAGKSERLVGEALKGFRHKVILSTKGGAHFNPKTNSMDRDLSPEAIRKDVEESLTRLQTDYIDLYFFHYPDSQHPIADSIGEMEKLREEGKIRMIGLSNYSSDELLEATKYGTIDCAQFRYSMLTRENENLLHICDENQIGVLSYASLAGGMLTGVYKEEPQFAKEDRRTFFYPFLKEPQFSKCRKLVDVVESVAIQNGISAADAAIQWVIAQEGMTAALVGTKNPERARKNADAFAKLLRKEDFQHFDEVYRSIFENRDEI